MCRSSLRSKMKQKLQLLLNSPRFAVLAVLITVSLLVLWSQMQEIRNRILYRYPDPLSKRPNGSLKIAFGTPYYGEEFGWKNYIEQWRNKGQLTCGYACDIVTDPTMADVVLFHDRDLPSKPPHMPRHPWQHWVYMTMESAVFSNKALSYPDYRFLFNWSATTMRDSTVHLPYQAWRLREKPIEGPFYSPQKKRYMAYIAISNCMNTKNRRLSKVAQLRRYLDVHLYGGCGSRALPKYPNVWRNISEQYRFYLSFENSFCRDYITEKFHHNGLESQAVPVVFGGLSRDDYERAGPPHSFVYALDFTNMRQLADHLKKLAADEARYASYHEWKRNYIASGVSFLCPICTRLHKNRSVGSFDIRRFNDVKRNCRSSNYKYLEE